MTQQLKSLGLAIDWGGKVTTCKPDYYRLAVAVHRCCLKRRDLQEKRCSQLGPVDQTVLANETGDRQSRLALWRSGGKARNPDVLLPHHRLRRRAAGSSLDNLPGWPEQVKPCSATGSARLLAPEIVFDYDVSIRLVKPGQLKVYTTRPDTLMGANYVAVAAEHPLATRAAEKNPALAAFIANTKKTSSRWPKPTWQPWKRKACQPGESCHSPADRRQTAGVGSPTTYCGAGEGAVMAGAGA